MNEVKFFFNQTGGERIPLEMHKAKMVQRLHLLPVDERQAAIENAGFNTFLLKNRDVFLDMLTDSGVNAMSDEQYAALLRADDSYAGSETFYRLEAELSKMFGKKYFLPAHQGRACEHILAKTLVKPGQAVIMNFHFTTTKAHITLLGGKVIELLTDEGLKVESDIAFKGDMDIEKLKSTVQALGKENIAFIRVEAGTNLIGGQPVSVKNMREVSQICKANGITSVFDASLLSDNLYFIKTREQGYENTEISDITREIASLFDIVYFSARKLGCVRGGGILTSNDELHIAMRELVTLYEGFLTYGGMSVKEMEALAVGLREALDFNVIEQTPIFVEALTNELRKFGVPTVLPAGGLGCHIDAKRFLEHIPQSEYPAGALAAAIYLVGGIRGMERGTLSEQRNDDGSEHFAEMELVRLALPKRVFTLSHIKFVADRVAWLYRNRHLIGGLEFVDEPSILRFFFGRLRAKNDWHIRLTKAFKRDFGESL